jgi:hypothetical protein
LAWNSGSCGTVDGGAPFGNATASGRPTAAVVVADRPAAGAADRVAGRDPHRRAVGDAQEACLRHRITSHASSTEPMKPPQYTNPARLNSAENVASGDVSLIAK